MRFAAHLFAAGIILSFGLSVAIAETPAQSASHPATPQPTAQQIVEQQTGLRADVEAKKGAFKDLTDSEREALIKAQTRVLTLLDGRSDIDQLRTEEKVELFNHLQWISATVRQAEDDRQVCERSRVVGSNRFKVVCMTAKQYRDYKERAQQSLRTAMKCQGPVEGCKNEDGGALGSNFKLASGF